MNDKLTELAIQAGLEEGCVHGDWTSLNWPDVRAEDLERFAELVRADERDICAALCLEPIQYGRVENNRSTCRR